MEGTDGFLISAGAEEMTDAARQDILHESGTAILARANLFEQSALALLEWASGASCEETEVLE
jgi:hypothetical protein